MTSDRFEAVVVDGNPKRWKILACEAGEIPAPGEGENPAALASSAVAAVLKKIGAPRDPVTLTLSSSGSVFRNMQLPFTGDDAIKKVLKFECEGQLHQFNIDDVIVAYMPVLEHKAATDIIVAAAPKKLLKPPIDLLETAGFDPLLVDLDAFSLYNAIQATAAIGPDRSALVLHLGREESLALSIEKGRLRLIRSMRFGYAPPHALVAGVKEEAQQGDADASARAIAAPQGEGETVPSGHPEQTADAPAVGGEAPAAVLVARDANELALRLERESMRIIAAEQGNGPEEVLISGDAAAIPGLLERLEAALEIPVRELDVFENAEGAPGDVALRRNLGFALGGALKGIGVDATKTDFRQEELKFAKKLEALKVPLASLVGIIAFTLLLQNIYAYREMEAKYNHLTNIATAAERILTEVPPGAANLAKKMKSIVTSFEKDPPADRPRLYANRLDAEIRTLRDVYGTGGTSLVKPQSAFEATQRMFKFLSKNQDDLGEFVLDKYSAVTDTNNPQTSRVTIKLQVTFLGEGGEATVRTALMLRRLREQKWAAEVREGPSTPVPGGVTYDGLTVVVDLQREVANP